MTSFDYCPLVWFLTSRSRICKLERKKIRKGPCDLDLKILYHAITNPYLRQRWVLSGSVQLKKWSMKYLKYWNILALAILKIISPKTINPCNLHDNNKLVQPMKLTAAHGIKSFQYYGVYLWNNILADIKPVISISQSKGLIRKWPGSECKCSVCIMILWYSEHHILRLFYPRYIVYAIFMFYCLSYTVFNYVLWFLVFVSWWQWFIVSSLPGVSSPVETRSCPESTRCCSQCVIPLSWCRSVFWQCH